MGRGIGINKWEKTRGVIRAKDYYNFLYEEFNLFTIVESKRITRVFFKTVGEILKNGRNIYLKEFGRFEIRETTARFRMNLNTKEQYWSTSKKRVRFKPNARTNQDIVRQRGYVPMPELKLQYKYQRLRH